MTEGGPEILVNPEGLPCAPEQPAAKKGEEKGNAIVELATRAGHVQLIEEPVEVEGNGRQLVQDEGRGIIVDEWSLEKGRIR